MSRRKRFLCVLLALAAVIGGICCWQRNNLRALGMSLRLSQDAMKWTGSGSGRRKPPVRRE